jgi:hypothetical protein
MTDLHFLLRYSDKLLNVDTINEHKTILHDRGAVWIGKFGIGISQKIKRLANLQIKENNDCFLYLIQGSKYTHKAIITKVISAPTHNSSIYTKEPLLTPKYYRKKKCSVWFKLTDIISIKDNEINECWLFNQPNIRPSTNSMRGLIYLTHTHSPLPKTTTPVINNILYTGGLFD